MLRTTGLIGLLAVAATTAAPALADGPSYNYLDLRYQEIEIDDSLLDVDGETYSIGGSFEVGDTTHVFAGYGTSDFDFGVDFDELTIGAGIHSPLTPSVDFVANIAYVRLEASALGSSFDDDGFGASVGLRAMSGDRLELAGHIDYVDLDDSGDTTSYGADLWYNFTENFALGINADFGDDIDSYGVGARFYFGR